ncbi:sucrose nonfermenting 4-like protein isoform X2 [Aristolochia californica]|uniref:sucrose nonfermenting 4-like protein isoform X2 n=1 Tax=Aristolochia californica TaxID=171875 RepID=UPI0035D91932
MVPTRFAWPYGGRQVFLSGSFDRWTERIPMTLVENSSTVFQTICNLAPGYHQASLPGGVQQVPVAHIPVQDFEDLHHWLLMLLSRYTAYELLPQSGKVFALSVKLPVKLAFCIMYEQGLAVMPLWDDCLGQVSGMLTASDFIMILRELHTYGSTLTSEELEMHSVSAWKEWKCQLSGDSSGTRRALIHAGPHESLKDVASRIVHNGICAIPIINPSTQDGSSHQLLHLACLPGILKYICEHFRHSRVLFPLLQQPIYRIPIGTWVTEIDGSSGPSLTVLRANAPLSMALNLLLQDNISSIPIVDENGSLLDVYSRSDIMALANGEAYACIHLDQTSMHQALQMGYQANGTSSGARRCHTCLRSDSFHEILERLSDPAVRRLIVIEPHTQRVEGVISLRDAFSFFLG